MLGLEPKPHLVRRDHATHAEGLSRHLRNTRRQSVRNRVYRAAVSVTRSGCRSSSARAVTVAMKYVTAKNAASGASSRKKASGLSVTTRAWVAKMAAIAMARSPSPTGCDRSMAWSSRSEVFVRAARTRMAAAVVGSGRTPEVTSVR